MKIKPLLGLLISLLILLYYSSAGAEQELPVRDNAVTSFQTNATPSSALNTMQGAAGGGGNAVAQEGVQEGMGVYPSAQSQLKSAPQYPSTSTSATQTIIGLGFTVGLIFVIAWGLKKLNNRGYGLGRSMKVIEVLPLGTREKAVLVDVHGKKILIGVAPGTVSGLHVFEDGFIIDEAANQSQQAVGLSAKTSAEFSKKLNAFLGGSRGEA